MDILAARRKAAEQAGAANKPAQEAAPPSAQPAVEPAIARSKPEPEAAVPAEQPAQEQKAQPAPAESRPDGIVGSPVAEVAAPSTGASPPAPGEPEESKQEEIELLSFRLSGEEYTVLVADVREVLKNYQLTKVPNTPDYLLGVMSLRGTMLPVIDLCRRFGLAPGTKDEKSRIIVVSSAGEEAGLQVDRVTGVFRILPDEIKPVPENIEQGAEFLRGIVRTANRLYILLDLKKALGV